MVSMTYALLLASPVFRSVLVLVDCVTGGEKLVGGRGAGLDSVGVWLSGMGVMHGEYKVTLLVVPRG
jgi:hypothetical protein